MAMLAAAPSKVPFYIAGGLLAAWAVVLAVNGIRRPGFPGSRNGRVGVILASSLLVLATLSAAVLTAGEEGEGEAAAPASSELALAADPDGAAAYDRATAAVRAGTVTITLANDSPLDHNVAVAREDRELGRSAIVRRAATRLELGLPPGEYAFYCTVEGHREAGMEGTLSVR